jgi:predicted Zn finger-like uncharacterized protein
MLFTRCPECETTFRVTDETLKKANGQVRCGRCASVFNAYAELHDPSAKSFEAEAPSPHAVEQPAASAPPPSPPAPSAPAAAPTLDSGNASEEPTGAELRPASVAGTVAEAERAAAHSAVDGEPPPDADAISATEVERVLTTTVNPPLPPTVYAWPPAASEAPVQRASRWWSAAAALALLALGAQAVHQFRSELAGDSVVGPLLARVYGAFGSELTPSYDVRQYEILDWVATAEPNSRGLGSLKITARIQNHGPQRQPFPAVKLRLKDRWEEAVGSRMFTPAEYLPRDAPRGRLMSPGETARAEIELVDPGPDAYGFELDVCIEVEASLVTCGTDEVFL